MKLRKNFVKTTSFKNSYFNRIVDSWNCLPREVRFSHDLHSGVVFRGIWAGLGWPGNLQSVDGTAKSSSFVTLHLIFLRFSCILNITLKLI